MNAGEAAPRPLLSPQPLLNQRQDDVTVELIGSVLRKAGDAGLRGVPVALVLHIEMIGLLGEAVQRVSEDGNALSRLDAAELDALLLDTPIGRLQCGSRAQIDGARHAAGRRVAPQVWMLAIEAQRQRVGTIHISLDDGRPGIFQVACQFVLHQGIVDRHTCRQDEQARVLALPEGMDDGGHEAQDTACALETVKLGPVTIQAVKQFGMDGIGSLQATLVVPLSTVGWKLLRLSAIQVVESPCDRIAGGEVPLLRDGLEETPAHDLEAFLGAGRSPRGLQTAERVAQAYDGLLSPLATNLNVGSGDAGHQKCLG